MKRLILKGTDRMWPTVIWEGSQLVVYYLGEDEGQVKLKETKGIDFEEFFLHLDNGGSVFVTMKPGDSHMKNVVNAAEIGTDKLYDYA